MKVLMIIRQLRYSGAYKMFMWVASALANRGHSVTICTWNKSDVKELPPIIKWIELNLDGKCFLFVINEFRRVVKDENADVSISFLLDGNVLNTLGCMGGRTKSVICERNDPYKPGYIKLKIFKPLFRLSDGAVFQLPKVAEYYNIIRKNKAIIPNPVLINKLPVIDSFKNRSCVINVLARLDIFQKRHDILLKSFSIFVKKHPEYELRFYGDGLDKEKLINLCKDLDISIFVKFMGIAQDPINVMKDSKFYVMTSDFEGIPNSLIEAMSLGLPCITTDCSPGGARLLINNGINGLIVPKGDVQAIADKMTLIAENSELADFLGVNAKSIKETFSEEKITDLWCDFLKKSFVNNEVD